MITNYKNIEEDYRKNKMLIKDRLKEFSKNKDYFYELCFCLLTPQSKAVKCNEAVQILKQKDFKNKNIKIENILKSKTRFYNNKSKYLQELKKKYPSIETNLKTNNPYALREYLVREVKGMSYKEASHFLRNIGYRDLAILDRHILNYLKKYNVIKEIPKTLPAEKYHSIEEKFKEFSEKVKIPMDELDLLFWSMKTGVIFR